MFKKILLATDFSDASETAKWLTEELVGDTGRFDLMVLTVFNQGEELPEEGVFLPSDLALAHEVKKFRAEREEALIDYCRALKNRGIAADRTILEGVPSERILEFAVAWGAEVIVIGATGQSSSREMSLGKTAEALLRHSTIPVLVAAHRPR